MSIKRYAVIFSFSAFLTWGIHSAPAAGKPMYINGIDADYPPFTFISKQGSPDGLDIKAVDWIAGEMGFRVVHVPMDWADIIPSLQAEKIDFIASGMNVTPERKRKVSFSISYYKTTMVLITKQGSNLTAAEALAGNVKWGVQRGTNEASWIEKNLVKRAGNLDLVFFDTATSAMEAVLKDGVDCAAVSMTSAENFRSKGKHIRIIGSYGQPDRETAYAVRKGDKELLRLLNEGLRRLMRTPYWKELKTSYGLQ